MISAVLTDFDGTLIDSERLHQQTIANWLHTRRWDNPSHLRAFLGRRALDVFREVDGPWAGQDPQVLLAEIWSHFDLDSVDPIVGASELMNWVRSAKLQIALVTSGTRWWIETGLSNANLPYSIDDFDSVISSEVQEFGKPDPSGYLLAIESLAATAKNCVVLEDTPAGVEAGRAAKVGLVIGVTSSQPETALLSAGADLVVPDLSTIPQIIHEIG